MDAANWLSLLGFLVAVLAFSSTFFFRRSDKQSRDITELKLEIKGQKEKSELQREKADSEAQLLRDALYDAKLQIIRLQGVADVIDRTFSGLPGAINQQRKDVGGG